MLMPACADRLHLIFWSKVKTTEMEESSIPETPSSGLVETSAGAGDGSGSGVFSQDAATRQNASINIPNGLFIALWREVRNTE